MNLVKRWEFILTENWSRFLDDCVTPADKTKTDPHKLLQILNSVKPSVTFTTETSDKELPFLDILIKRNDHKIWMDINFKPADARRSLPFSSSHPNYCKKNQEY